MICLPIAQSTMLMVRETYQAPFSEHGSMNSNLRGEKCQLTLLVMPQFYGTHGSWVSTKLYQPICGCTYVQSMCAIYLAQSFNCTFLVRPIWGTILQLHISSAPDLGHHSSTRHIRTSLLHLMGYCIWHLDDVCTLFACHEKYTLGLNSHLSSYPETCFPHLCDTCLAKSRETMSNVLHDQ